MAAPVEGLYRCPKCDGTDMYFQRKQEITGLGGIYGQRARMVKRPFCRACDVEGALNDKVVDEDYKQLVSKRSNVISFSIIGFLAFLFLIFYIGLSTA
jgi:hypothetical protein